MKRLGTFLLGMIAGAAAFYVALNYHLVRTSDGLHLVAKTSATLRDTYVDVRAFGPLDWAQHVPLGMALNESGQTALKDAAVGDAVETGLGRLLDRRETRR